MATNNQRTQPMLGFLEIIYEKELKKSIGLGVVAYTFNSSISKAENGGAL